MPFEDKQIVPSYVDCQKCGWDAYEDTDPKAQMLAVLHVLVKHPDEYVRTTGKDPEVAKRQYAEYIRAFQSRL